MTNNIFRVPKTTITVVVHDQPRCQAVQDTVECFSGELPDQWPPRSYTLPFAVTVDNSCAVITLEQFARRGVTIQSVVAECTCATIVCHCRGCAINALLESTPARNQNPQSMNSEEKTFTTLIPSSGGWVRLSHNCPKRPSWKTHGQGRAIVEMDAKAGCDTIQMRCAEVPESCRGSKEVYVSVPVSSVIELLERVGYKITKE